MIFDNNSQTTIPVFATSNDFSIFIEKTALVNQWTRIETLAWYCEETGAEYEEVAKNISPSLKENIRRESLSPKQTTIIDDT